MLALLLAAAFPAFTGYVVDSAGVIPAEDAGRISSVCERLDRAGTAQLAVATVRETGDLDRRQYAVELFQRWKLGHSKERSDGLLLLFTPAKDGRFSGIKVEVGYDLEGILPDGKVGALIDQHAGPHLREGHVGAAAGALALALAAEIEAHPDGKAAGPRTARSAELFSNRANLVAIFSVVWAIGMAIAIGRARPWLTALAYGSAPAMMALAASCGSSFGQAVAALALPLFLSVRAQAGLCPVCGAPDEGERKIVPVPGTARYRLIAPCRQHPRGQERAAE